MANYFLMAFDTAPQTLALLRNEENIGSDITALLYDNRGMDFSPRQGRPTPRPLLTIDDHVLGSFLGCHYDGRIAGHDSPAPQLPPGHVAVTFKGDRLHEIEGRLKGSTLHGVIASFLDNPDDPDSGVFDRIEDDRQLPLTRAFFPLLINDTDQPVDFSVIKTTLVRLGDGGLAETIPGDIMPYNMPVGYKAPPLASSYTRERPAVMSPIHPLVPKIS